MVFNINIIPYTLHFRVPAGTSRGVYYDHKVWYVVVSSSTHPSHIGVGECAPLPDLSCDALPEKEYLSVLHGACNHLKQTGILDYESLRAYPSILFGLETALMHYEKESPAFWNTPFAKGKEGITINGLIWMGDVGTMLGQIEQKLEQGYGCVKLKIGAVDFEEEWRLLHSVRSRFSSSEITLRVDANGVFTVQDAPGKLNRLAELDIHSIEQPIRAGQWDEMYKLASTTPIPIALDEELIGVNNKEKKEILLKSIQPQYIILKPSLHGGWQGCNEWIELAEQNNIGWWVTSALESNVGLNAIAQWCACLNTSLPQGLGTGMLYTNNIPLPLSIRKDKLYFAAGDEEQIRQSLNIFYSGI